MFSSSASRAMENNREQMEQQSRKDSEVEKITKYMIDDRDDSQTIIYSQVPMNNLVQTCFRNIPLKYRERCLTESFERYAGSVYPQKSRCCTKWSHIECMKQYTYNNIYCNVHQQTAVKRYFEQIRSLRSNGSPECADYRPIDEEQSYWSSDFGRMARCAESVEYEFRNCPQNTNSNNNNNLEQ
ncbi:hypothetical protein NH340_JMT06716 [Sarcoptes scabiei]|nr:hypothetical protein NH340_JMT06716 [Sarcoptes scabiei]